MADDNKIYAVLELDGELFERRLTKAEANALKSGEKIGNNLGKGAASGAEKGLSAFKIGLFTAAFSKAFDGIAAIASKSVGFFSEAITASQHQQDAIFNLNTALASAGDYSKAASQGMIDFAESLENSSVFSQEASLDALTLAKAFGLTNERSKELVQAAANLSGVTGEDLRTSVEQLGKTLLGTAGRIAVFAPQLKTMSESALKSGGAIDVLNEKFAGVAASKLQTFSGSIIVLKNRFDEMFKTIGSLITRNPVLVEALRLLGDGLNKLIVVFKSSSGDITNFISSAIKPLAGFFTAAAGGVLTLINAMAQIKVAAAEMQLMSLKDALKVVNDNLNEVAESGQFTSGLITFKGADKELVKQQALLTEQILKQEEVAISANKMAFDVQSGINTLRGVFEGINDKIQKIDIKTGLKKIKDDFTNSPKVDVGDMFDFSKIAEKLGLPVEFVKLQIKSISDSFGETIMKASTDFETIVGIASSIGAPIQVVIDQIKRIAVENKISLDKAAKRFSVFYNEVSSVVDGLITSSLTNLGAALVGSGGGFQAFARQAGNILGDFFIKMGMTIIAADTAIIALKTSLLSFFGGGGIATGIGLVIAGGALKALSGGPSSASVSGGAATSSAGIAGTTTAPSELVSQVELPPQEPQTNVTVNVSGVVTDPRGTAKQISDILTSGFKTSNINLSRAVV